MNRELLKRVITECSDEGSRSNITPKLYGAIAEYLEMPEPEPVAWMWEDGLEVYFENSGDPDHNWVPLYTTQPDQSAQISELIAQRTLQESIIKSAYTACRELEERLADQSAQIAALKHELQQADEDYVSVQEAYLQCQKDLYDETEKLAALQAKREPLSDDEIRDCAESENLPYFENKEEFDAFARAIEKAHGIGTNHD